MAFPPAVFDLLAGVLVLALAAWGARRGAGRAALALGLFLGAVEAASLAGPAVEHPLTQITGVDAPYRHAAAWAAALALGLLVGGLALASCAPARVTRTRADRWAGGLLAALCGVLLSAVAVHLMTDAGMLERDAPPSAAASRAVRLLEPLRAPLARALRLPDPPDPPEEREGG